MSCHHVLSFVVAQATGVMTSLAHADTRVCVMYHPYPLHRLPFEILNYDTYTLQPHTEAKLQTPLVPRLSCAHTRELGNETSMYTHYLCHVTLQSLILQGSTAAVGSVAEDHPRKPGKQRYV